MSVTNTDLKEKAIESQINKFDRDIDLGDDAGASTTLAVGRLMCVQLTLTKPSSTRQINYIVRILISSNLRRQDAAHSLVWSNELLLLCRVASGVLSKRRMRCATRVWV